MIDAGVIVLYSGFLILHFYLLGRLVDDTLKIYYKVITFIDRFLVRVFVGLFLASLFGFIASLSPKWVGTLIFTLFSLLPFVYIFIHYRKKKSLETSLWTRVEYLDRVEKLVFVLSIVFFIVSFPKIESFETVFATVNFIRPTDLINISFSPVIKFLYLPLLKTNISPSLITYIFFYIFFWGGGVLAFYGLLRTFYSRKTGMIGILCLLTAWPVSKQFYFNIGDYFVSCFPIIWLWATIWMVQSSSYRSGFCIGAINFIGFVLEPRFIILPMIEIPLILALWLPEKNRWYKNQIIKYLAHGTVFIFLLNLITDYLSLESFLSTEEISLPIGREFFFILQNKAFLVLSFIGIILSLGSYLKLIPSRLYKLDYRKNTFKLIVTYLVIMLVSRFLTHVRFEFFPLITLMIFFALLPLDFLFVSLMEKRSMRYRLFGFYVIICLIDSHFEGRIKNLYQVFKNESQKERIQELL